MPFRFPTRRRSGRGRGVGSSLKVRLLIGVVIALFALGTFYFGTRDNPFTDETDRVGNITHEQEVAIGLNAAPEMVQQMGGAVSDRDPEARRVEQIGRRLLDDSGVSEILAEKNIPYEFHFTLLDDEQTVNAFALPGGPVFMTEALYDRLQNEAQVAGVVGHEIGHVIYAHGGERMAKANLGQSLVGAVAVGAGDQGYTAAQMAQFVNGFLQLKYGREQELESDDAGLDMMVDAGYDPREMVEVMKILAEASGGSGNAPAWSSTHPDPLSRISEIETWINEKFPDGVPDDLTAGAPLR